MNQLIAEAVKNGQRALSEHTAKRLLAAYDIPVTRETLVKQRDDAVAAAEAIGYPVAVKACAPDLMHKSESGAVAVGIDTSEALLKAYDRVTAAANMPLEGVLVQEMVPGRRELVAGMLEELGAELLQADDGQHALDLAAGYDGEIHLLMTDVLMPGMKGWELADKLCAKRPDMRVLYMSGWIGDDASPDLGGREAPLLLKPFRSRDLLFKLHEALQDSP